MRRRTLLAAVTALCTAWHSVVTRAQQWHREAFSATSLDAAMGALFGARTPEASAAVVLEVEDKIENGAVVPVQVKVNADHVRVINVFAELNPNPLLARFHLSPRCRPVVATRIKVGAPSELVVVAETDDRLLAARRFVDVVEGGCG